MSKILRIFAWIETCPLKLLLLDYARFWLSKVDELRDSRKVVTINHKFEFEFKNV